MLSMEEIAVLNGEVTEGFTEEVTFQQSFEKEEAMTHQLIWSKNFVDKEYKMCLNPKVGIYAHMGQVMLYFDIFATIIFSSLLSTSLCLKPVLIKESHHISFSSVHLFPWVTPLFPKLMNLNSAYQVQMCLLRYTSILLKTGFPLQLVIS